MTRARFSSTSPSKKEACLIIFAKAPIPGQVKTRLCPPLTHDEAATLHGSLVMDILEKTNTTQTFDRVLACAPDRHHPFFQTVGARYRIPLIDQQGPDLGVRMHQAFQDVFARDYKSVLLMGTDLPTVSLVSLTNALQQLSKDDVVLGPTQDGGYYVVGLKTLSPELFFDIPWSSDQVLRRTQDKADALHLKVSLANVERDLDTIQDLRYFIDEATGPHARRISSRTGGVLRTLAARLRGRSHADNVA